MTLADELTAVATSLETQPDAARRAWAERPHAFRSLVMSEAPDPAALVAKLRALADTCRDAAAHGGVLKGLSD